jgi:hypothetical protein
MKPRLHSTIEPPIANLLGKVQAADWNLEDPRDPAVCGRESSG